MPQDFEATGVLDHLARLSSAEEIFTYLLLPYRQDVVNVARLHILKRFGAYLRGTDFEGHDQQELFLDCRKALKRAHDDFVASTPLQEKVFKVLRDGDTRQRARFVGLDQLTLSAE